MSYVILHHDVAISMVSHRNSFQTNKVVRLFVCLSRGGQTLTILSNKYSYNFHCRLHLLFDLLRSAAKVMIGVSFLVSVKMHELYMVQFLPFSNQVIAIHCNTCYLFSFQNSFSSCTGLSRSALCQGSVAMAMAGWWTWPENGHLWDNGTIEKKRVMQFCHLFISIQIQNMQ